MIKITSNLFNTFLENNVEGIWIIDEKNKTMLVNQFIADSLGFPKKHFLGWEIPDFLEEKQAATIRARLNNQIIQSHEQFELKFIKADHSPVWMNCALGPLYNEEHQYVGAIGVLTDITIKKKNEIILETQRDVFESLIRGETLKQALNYLLSPIDTLVQDVYPSILLLDENGERLYTAASLNLPQEYNESINGTKIGINSGSCGTSAYLKELVITSDIMTDPYWADYRELAKKYGLCACWSSPIISFDGKVLGTFAMYFNTIRVPTQFELDLLGDITSVAALCIEHIRLHENEKKHNRKMNLLAEARLVLAGTIEYEDVLKNIPDLLVKEGWANWSFICLENEDGLFRTISVATNPELADLIEPLKHFDLDLNSNFGLSRAVRQNSAFIENYDQETLRRSLEAENHKSLKTPILEMLIKLDLKSLMGIPLMARDEVFGGLVLGSNYKNRVYTESDLELMKEISRSCSMAIDYAILYREAKKSIQAREDFISIASHELRTPITSLKLRTDLLALMIEKGKFPKEVIDLIGPIISEIKPDIKNFMRLIETLLDISKISGKEAFLNRKRCNFSNIIRDEALRNEVAFQGQNVELKLDIQADIYGLCDEVRIQQIVSNLLMNALKFGKKRPVELRVREIGKHLELCVKDYGMGIPEKDRERIYRPFERAVSGVHFGGLGLGLYITHQIVVSHGGTIRVEGLPGKGSTFIVQIPLFNRI